MATTTTNLGLKKPASTDKVSIDDINANMDIIDTIVDMIPEVDDALDSASTNPLQNKVVNQAIYNLGEQLRSEIPDVTGYLPLTGGTITGSGTTPLTLKSGNAYYSFLGFARSTGSTVYLGSFNGKPVFNNGTNHELAFKSDVPTITTSTSEPTSSDGADGDFWAVYE